MPVYLYSHNYSSCDNVLARMQFHVCYGSGTPYSSEMCNLNVAILPMITFQRYPTDQVQCPCSANDYISKIYIPRKVNMKLYISIFD